MSTLNYSALKANEAALKAKGFLPGAPPPGQPVVELPPQVMGPAAPVEIAPQVSGPAVVELPPQVSKPSWNPTAAELLGAAPPSAGAPGVSTLAGPPPASAGFLPAAPVTSTGPNLLPNVPHANPAAPPKPQPKPAEISPLMIAGPHPAPAPPAGAGGPPPPPAPIDKKAAVLLPGQDEAHTNELEAQTMHGVWDQAAADEQQKIEQEKIAQQKEAEAKYAEDLAKELAEREKFQQYQDAEHAKLDTDSKRIANTKIDPNRMFKGGEGVWSSILAGIAGALGVMGAPATGGKNAGVEAVQKQIDRDVDLQARDLENQKGEVARQQGFLAQKYAQFGNLQQAKAAARIDGYRLAQRQIDTYAAERGGEVYGIRAAQANDDLERAIEREKEQFNLGVEAKFAQQQALLKQQQAAAAHSDAAKGEEERKYWRGVAGEGFKKALEEFPGAQLVFDAKTHQPIGVVDPNGKLVYGKNGAKGEAPVSLLSTPNDLGETNATPATAHSQEAATKYNEEMGKINDALAALAEMRKMRKKNDGGKIIASSEDKARAEDLRRRLFTGAKTLGENSDKDAERIEKTLPDPLATDAFAAATGGKSYTDTLLDQQEKTLLAKKERAEKMYLKPGTTAPTATTLKPVK